MPFGQGLDTKTDKSAVPASKLMLLENGQFPRPRSLRKRNGYKALPKTIGFPGASFLTVGQAIAAYRGELLLFDATSLYSYDAANQTWFSKGAFVSANVTQQPVVRNTYQQTGQDSAYHPSGLQLFAWEDSSGGSRYSVVDSSTGQTVVANQLVLATAVKPKCLAIGNFLVLLYVNTADARIYGAPIAVSQPAAALAPVALSAASGNNQLNATAPNYDATVITTAGGAQLYVAYNNSTVTTGGISAFGSSSAAPLTFGAPVSVALEAGNVVTVFADSYRKAPVVAWYNGTAVKFAAYDAPLGTVLGSGTVETVASVVSLTGASTSSTGLALRLFYGVSAAATYNYLTRTCAVTGSYAVGAAAVLLRSVAPCGKAFVYGSSSYVPLAYQSPLQPSYFVSDASGNLVAKILWALGGGIPTRASLGAAMLTEVNLVDGVCYFQIALLAKDLLTTNSGQVYTQTGVESVTLDFFDRETSYLRQELGQNLHLSGGFLSMYDGISAVEHGFHLFPEPVAAAAVGSGGSLSAGTYQVSVCYEWIDNQGQTHRSAPSIPQSVAVVLNGSISVTIPTLRLTAKQARSPVLCVVYCTNANGTTFFQDSSVTAPVLNSTTADTVSYTVTAADTARLGNPLLYTTGGVIENVAPNAVSAMFVHRNRLWALDPTNPLQWWYSKQVLPPSVGVNAPPAEFSDSFIYSVDPRGGACTAGASMDGNAIFFKASTIFAVAGEGPDSTGAQNDLRDAIPVTSDVGCQNPRSIVLTPKGLMFQSAKGIYLLDRSLSVSYIGAEVEAYNAETVTSAQLIPNANQVRLTLASGVALVFDYLMEQWAVFTPLNAVDSAIFQGLFTYLTPQGVAMQETPGVFSDNGNFIKLRAKTSWLQFAGVNGFQRVYRALLLGEYESPHNLLVQVSYDFNPAIAQSDTIVPTPGSTYGGASPYGSDASYGGEFEMYEFEVLLARQKCTALQFTIEDVSTGDAGEGMNLSALTLEVGVKAGSNKLGAGRTYG